ncbi:MAG: SAM-dependent methyltransferase [Anaerolineae bacterium]
MASHPLWLTEWLTGFMDLEPEMRILDLGCGKAKSSIFLAREFATEVWAVDLWTGADENLLRIEAAGMSDRVLPLHADARQLPFAGEFFDAVVCIDSFQYFATDDLYLNYLAHFVREGGTLAFVSPGLVREFGGPVPNHLQRLWTGDYWALHSAAWWREHVAKTALFEVAHAGDMPGGWSLWAEWAAATDSAVWYRDALAADAGRYLGYVGLVATRVGGQTLAEHAWPATLSSRESRYTPHPLLRSQAVERPAGRSGLKALFTRLSSRGGRGFC